MTDKKGFASVIIILVLLVAVSAGAYFVFRTESNISEPTPTPEPTPGPNPKPVACTMEAKICPDGSAVGRVGPNCEFAPCPTTKPPVGRDTTGKDCAGPSDRSCGVGYECISRCGPPVAREGDPPAGFYCRPKGYIQQCPICLAENTLISTPEGNVPVQDLQVGEAVWSVNENGERVAATIVKTSKTPVPLDHMVVWLKLADGREVFVSPGHPIADGRTVGELVAGEVYDGLRILTHELVSYGGAYTYDLLPSGPTGFYFANGILLGSTLR